MSGTGRKPSLADDDVAGVWRNIILREKKACTSIIKKKKNCS